MDQIPVDQKVELVDGSTIDIDKVRTLAKSLTPIFKRLVEQVSVVANGLVKLWGEAYQVKDG